MRLLLINPNTSSELTALLHEQVQSTLGGAARLESTTARFGARYIADEASFAVAGHAALEAYAAHADAHGEPDAVLLACFGDPGVWALRQLARRPVIGLAEAAMREAAGHGRFAIVTGGLAWKPMLERMARTLGMNGALAGVHAIEPSGAALAADPDRALAVLETACREAASHAHAVVLGGAALAGLGRCLEPALAVPLIDSVAAGARAVLRMATEGLTAEPPAGSPAGWHGVSGALLRRMA
ncbi:MAG TPA: aspartate/glutamate racemase family protein [Albitalea sp.]|uniref:aspartate/glutamate racemase family protein n=1 Tax=Piscinibacter sp. TaxID=1903157 RepID=UPI002ED1BD48